MSLTWTAEPAPTWNADKQRIIGDAAPGTFDRRYSQQKDGESLPGEWWHVERDGKTVGFGWFDLVWGDAEITIASDPEHRGEGVGSFILGELEKEAQSRGVNYVYNTVRPTHPDKESVTAWLQKRGFHPSEDGSLLRAFTRAKSEA